MHVPFPHICRLFQGFTLIALLGFAACMTPDVTIYKQRSTAPLRYKVAVLPFSFQGVNVNPAHSEAILRRVFFNYFSYLSYGDLPLEEVDRRLEEAGFKDSEALASLTYRELRDILKVDAVIFGRVVDSNNFTGGIYAETRIQAQLQMMDLNDGQILWELDHHEMDVSGVASPTVVEIIQDQINNSEVEKAVIRTAESFSVRVLEKIPDPGSNAKVRLFLPVIHRIETNLPPQALLRPGDVLQVDLYGQAGLEASFDIGNIQTFITMEEITPGHYQGVYLVQQNDRFRPSLIIGRLKNEQGLIRKIIYKSSTKRNT